MDQLEKTKQKPHTYILAGGLYILTAAFAILTFSASRRMVLSTLTRFGLGGSLTNPLPLFNYIVSITLGIFCGIGIIIGGFEYHFQRAGTDESWWMFARTLGVEIGILLLALYI
jgi:hypothetical protein